MESILQKQLTLLYLLLWLTMIVIHSLFLFLVFSIPLVEAATDSLVYNVLFAGLGGGLWMMVRYSGLHRSIREMLVQHVSGITLTLVIWMSLGTFLLKQFFPNDQVYLRFLDHSYSIRLASGVFYYIISVVLFYFLLHYRELQQQKEREAHIFGQLREAELSLLRSQIRPHFLFNSLNSISSLTLSDPGKAQEMIIKLSEFMRYSLNFPDESMSTLERELYHIQLYLDIEKVRFGKKLKFEKEVSDNCMSLTLPSMILQPIIENAVKFGVYENTTLSSLILKAGCDQDYLKIYVENDFDPDAAFKKGTGTGLRNVAKRLQTVYGTQNLLRTRKENNLFIVEINIPKHG